MTAVERFLNSNEDATAGKFTAHSKRFDDPARLEHLQPALMRQKITGTDCGVFLRQLQRFPSSAQPSLSPD